MASSSPKDTGDVSASTFLDNIYPGKGQRNLKRILRQNPNIPTFQRVYSLHSMYAQAFRTHPSYKKNESTRAAKKQKLQEQKEGVTLETFQPESVLQFLSHLGVTATEAHQKISIVLRSKLEEQIEKVDLRKKESFDALSRLLIQGWEARDVPELRPILVTVIKKMAEKTPTQLLQRLADREDDGTLKYSELLAQFGLPMKRLVWEADWERGHSLALQKNNTETSSGIEGGDSATSSLLSDLLNAQIQAYCNDADLTYIADIAFVGSISERKIITQQRRSMANTVAAILPNANIFGKKDEKVSTKQKFASSASAIFKIKEIIGDRPNLLAAIFHLLIHKHGKSIHSSKMNDNRILGGKKFLACTLLSDILLSFGLLPKQYEYLGLLASILDDSVRAGILSNDSIAQIQGCLRAIFSQNTTSNSETKKKWNISPDNNSSQSTGTGTAAFNVNAPLPSKPKKYSVKEDATYVSSLLQEVIHSAIVAMKETDAKLVFLNPVTDAIAPGYSKVISKPMCILNISQKNNSKSYNSLQEFEKDVELMFQNCIKYNVGPDGVWFRGEAKRQRDIFKKNTGILSQAKGFWKKEIAERKKIIDKQNEKTWQEEKKKRQEQLKKKKILSEDFKSMDSVKNINKSDLAIKDLSARDISPLPPTKIKKKRKEPPTNSSTTIHLGNNQNDSLDQPSIHALASMILSDPFVVRLLLQKIFVTVRVLIKEKNVFLPSCHQFIPSLFQMLHIAQGSTQLCAIKGKKFTVPDAGLSKESNASSSGTITINIKQEKEENQRSLYFSTLRVYTPQFAEFLLSLALDDRLSIRGDLRPVVETPTQKLSPVPATSPEQWKNTSSLYTLRSLFQYAFVHIFVDNSSGRNNEKLANSLQIQIPRFLIVLPALSGSNMQGERPFWQSLATGILGWKRKLGIPARDLIVDFWFEWFKSEDTEKGCLCDAVHEVFLHLLNEWASLGNLILPRDKLLSLSSMAAQKAEPATNNEANQSDKPSYIRPFASAWFKKSKEFAPVKSQYESMLKSVGGKHAEQWKETMGIDEESFKKYEETQATAK